MALPLRSNLPLRTAELPRTYWQGFSSSHLWHPQRSPLSVHCVLENEGSSSVTVEPKWKQKLAAADNHAEMTRQRTLLIGSTEKEKLGAFNRVLDASIKYGVRNLKPVTYEEALALAQNKELELNNGKPKQSTSSTSSQQTNGKSQSNKTAKPNTPSKPKMTPDEKAKAGVIGGYLSPEEQKAYMAEQRCFGCHVKGHRKQDFAKWKER
ncbi:hypothetical protein L7F22_060258 [Adiantum nelumboides]|nr:hypothetical protein [Adiantum nelumboides]